MSQRRNRRASVEDLWRDRHNQPTKLDGIGKRWRARYVDGNGKEVTRRFDRKREAQSFLDDITTTLVTGTYVAPGAGKATIDQLHAQWLGTQAHLKATTRATREVTYSKHVEPVWGATRVAEVQQTAVSAWITKLSGDGAQPATIENSLGVLRMICAMAVLDRRIARNPCDGVKAPRREHSDRAYLSHRQVDQLARQVGERYRPTILILAYTGLRFGELAALTVKDLDLVRRRINVRQSVTEVKGKLEWSTPKTHERRSVPFDQFLDDDLANAVGGKQRDDLLFTAPEGGTLRIATFRTRIFTPAIDALRGVDEDCEPTTDYPKATLHDLRHTAASLAISAGANVKAVQTMLGHKSAAMTLDTYADLFPDDLEAVAAALGEARAAALK